MNKFWDITKKILLGFLIVFCPFGIFVGCYLLGDKALREYKFWNLKRQNKQAYMEGKIKDYNLMVKNHNLDAEKSKEEYT